MLFNESDRDGKSSYGTSLFANIEVSPQYRYVLWLSLYGKIVSNKGWTTLWSSSARASAEVYVPSFRYTLF